MTFEFDTIQKIQVLGDEGMSLKLYLQSQLAPSWMPWELSVRTKNEHQTLQGFHSARCMHTARQQDPDGREGNLVFEGMTALVPWGVYHCLQSGHSILPKNAPFND